MKSMLFFLRAAALLDGLLLSYPLLAILEVSLTGRLSTPLSLSRLGIVLLSGALGAFIGWRYGQSHFCWRRRQPLDLLQAVGI